MNISILDLIIFFKKKIFTSIFVLILTFGLFYSYANMNKSEDELTFQVDLREWGYLNINTFPFLEKYIKYSDDIRFSILDSFDTKATCNTKDGIKNLLFCSVKATSIKLNNDYVKFTKQVEVILRKQDSELKYEIEGRISNIEETKNFIKKSSQKLIETDKIELLTDLNYKSYMQISNDNSRIELLKKIKNDFQDKVIIKNKEQKTGKPTYELKYGILFSILCLGIYLIMGLAYSINNKRSFKKTK